MPTTSVTGLLWGDEGKGKIIDLLAAEADDVVRYGGGHNAGHTLVQDGQKMVLHLVPCGIRYPGVRNLIGNGVVVDPFHLASEVERLRDLGFEVELGRNLLVSERCHLILPLHQQLDQVAERLRGSGRIGTTGRGIGPAYADRAYRLGLRLGDLLRPRRLEKGLEALLASRNPFLRAHDQPGVELEPLLAGLLELGQKLRPGIADTGALLRQARAQNRRILLEGAQGVLLDLEQGTYPYVTSSHSSTGGIATGTGMAPATLERSLGVVKAYSTRVGEGPFPTELHDATGERLREAGKEYGSTTGRPRRCGWFDTVAVRYATEVSGASSLVITNLDVLAGFDPLPVAVAYELPGGSRLDSFPAFDLEDVTPVYEEHGGFEDDISALRHYGDLPDSARQYIEAIEARVGVQVGMISVGPAREQVILR